MPAATSITPTRGRLLDLEEERRRPRRREPRVILYLEMRLAGVGANLQAGRPQALFESPFAKGSIDAANYDVTQDGQRFLMVQNDQQSSTSTMFHVLINWVGSLRSTLAPAR